MANKYQHSQHPAPAADATNALVDLTIAVPTQQGALKVTEKAPVPETHAGGRYINAQGKVVNAHGYPFESDEEADESEMTYEKALALGGAESPITQALLAQKRSKERKKLKKLQGQMDEPPQLDADIKAEQARAANPNAKPTI